jgi:hypothetical protein
VREGEDIVAKMETVEVWQGLDAFYRPAGEEKRCGEVKMADGGDGSSWLRPLRRIEAVAVGRRGDVSPVQEGEARRRHGASFPAEGHQGGGCLSGSVGGGG